MDGAGHDPYELLVMGRRENKEVRRMIKWTMIALALAGLYYAWTRWAWQTHPVGRWMPYEGERRAGR
jgi:hypothetical protein